MKKLLFLLAILVSAIGAKAQDSMAVSTVETVTIERALPSSGDYFQGLTRPLTFSRMVAPYALEVTFAKTVHIIFPAAIRYVDLGSDDLLAAKADGTDNVLRVKSAVRGFVNETNLAVITEDGAYYSFNAKYADEPVKLSVEMGFEMPASANFTPVYLPELGDSSPLLVEQIMHSINRNERREIRGINSKKFGVEFSVLGIYSHEGLIYFHTILKNESAIPLDIDYLNFKIVDRRVARRTARQEQIIKPLRSLNEVSYVDGRTSESTVFVLPKFTIPDNKQLVIELAEKDGGRHQKITVNSTQLLRAKGIEKLK